MGLPDANRGIAGQEHLRRVHHRINTHATRIEKVERRVKPYSVVTALPASPVNGQIIYYQSAAMATDGIVWQFKYNSSSASTYKWEFVGGPQWSSNITTAEAPSGTGSWLNLTTDGPKLVAPLAGDYYVRVECQSVTTAAAITTANFGPAAGDTSPTTWANSTSPAQSSFYMSMTAFGRLNAVSAATDLKCRYQSTATALNFQYRCIDVTPIRVG